MCENVVRRNLLGKLEREEMIKYVPDWFVTDDMVKNSKDEEWLG